MMKSNTKLYLGDYQILAELNRGAFGKVFLGTHLYLQRIVAIKIMHMSGLSSQKAQEGFLQEAILLERLKHPHIVPLITMSYYKKRPYLVMEYAAQGSLKERLHARAGRPLSEGRGIAILIQVGQALHYAHQQQVVHRDLKPANILLNAQGEVWLADFGIGTILEMAKTMPCDPAGTPAYMAPEQFQGKVSPKSDQYALGCIAYELVTGHQPFTAPDAISMGYKHATELPVPPTWYNPYVSKSMEAAILKAMAKQRSERFPDIASFITALIKITETKG